MRTDLVTHWGDDLTVVNAARVSMDSESEWEIVREYGPVKELKLYTRDEKLIHYLAKHKHTSCFEHQGATLRLKVPIFIARQIQRHRTFSYNEVSRRYVDTAPEFFFPDVWRARAANVKQGSSEEEVTVRHPRDGATVGEIANDAVRKAKEVYDYLLQAEVAPELARMILPQNMYTEFYMSGNLRSWSHFLHLRLDGHAQKEVRVVAEQVRDILSPLFPVSMKALLENP